MQYLFQFGAALFRYGAKWWGSLILAYIVGVGVFADYANIRTFVHGRLLIQLPEDIPVWFVILPILLWIAIGATHKEVIRQRIAPQIIYSDPLVCRALLGPLSPNANAETINIVKVTVRNSPVNQQNGKAAERAYAVAEFSIRIRRK